MRAPRNKSKMHPNYGRGGDKFQDRSRAIPVLGSIAKHCLYPHRRRRAIRVERDESSYSLPYKSCQTNWIFSSRAVPNPLHLPKPLEARIDQPHRPVSARLRRTKMVAEYPSVLAELLPLCASRHFWRLQSISMVLVLSVLHCTSH